MAEREKPMELDYSRIPKQQPYKIKLDDLQRMTDPSPTAGNVIVPLIVPRFQMHIYEGMPGATKMWHTHSPTMFQVLVGLEGSIEYEYIDKEREVQKFTLNPGEVVYIPGCFQHRVEVVGEERHRHLYVCPYVPEGRLEDLVGQAVGEDDELESYGAIKDVVGLWYDDVSDQVVAMDENAVEEL